jgi:hypothetical protein
MGLLSGPTNNASTKSFWMLVVLYFVKGFKMFQPQYVYRVRGKALVWRFSKFSKLLYLAIESEGFL